MRKILTKAEINRINRQKQIILGVVLIFLLVVSTAGFSWLSRDDKEKNKVRMENGLEFFEQNEIWWVEINGQVFAFSYLPSEVANVSIEGDYGLSDYSNKPLYFSELGDGAIEILSNLNSYILRHQTACVDGFCDEDIPVKNCSENFIIFIEGENRVYRDENCVYISGEQKKMADAFLYKVLNII